MFYFMSWLVYYLSFQLPTAILYAGLLYSTEICDFFVFSKSNNLPDLMYKIGSVEADTGFWKGRGPGNC